ncbi:hypothetical protein POX_d04986 [Penicillium oxalicum]|uniref:hypothetical protein n=1 Tax=Penicillium oxalicum TaxID=69781 RepID=UPI0020B6A1B3|nr:hypothetical protein POX_d04986 [Penicillium oxalicum]KAI2789494.1 hypothetical protein POX_d04986 [Penicillium oxalicum]
MDPEQQEPSASQGQLPNGHFSSAPVNIQELFERIMGSIGEQDSAQLTASSDNSTNSSISTLVVASPPFMQEMRYTPRAGLWCGHETVLRSWNIAGSSHCQFCGRSERWLWTCTADTPDHSPYEQSPEPVSPDRSILAPRIQQAILQGEYTEAQVEIMVGQKLKVLEEAAAARQLASENVSSGRDILVDNALSSEGTHPETAPPMQAAVAQQSSTHNDIGHAVDVIASSSPPDGQASLKACRLLACANCKPRLLEQSWGHIDAVVGEPYVTPPQIPEYQDRPISDATALRQMHEHCPEWEWSPDFEEWWSTARVIRGFDLLPLLLTAELLAAGQNEFIRLVGHLVIGQRVTFEEMRQSIWETSPLVYQFISPFLQVGDFSDTSHQEDWAMAGIEMTEAVEESEGEV